MSTFIPVPDKQHLMASHPIWLFDLDNTLHDAMPHIFPHINQCMTAYIARHLNLSEKDAYTLREHYWHRYGATLTGLVRHHGIDPHHFLHETHHFDHLPSMLVFERSLNTLLRKLPGRKFIFSNAPQAYITHVLHHMGINHHFDHIESIEKSHFRPKPGISSYLRLLNRFRLSASNCIMVEDSHINLRTAHHLGMRTILVSRNPRYFYYVDTTIHSILELYRATSSLIKKK